MGFYEFLLAFIVFTTAVSVGITYFTGRAVYRGAKRLAGHVRERLQLPGQVQTASQEAQDVVVEPVDDVPPRPAGVKNSRQQADDAASRGEYVHLNVDAGTTSKDIVKVMQRYVDDPVVGSYARAVIDTLRSRELRRQSITAELEGTFQRNTISWDKFAVPTQAALDAILRNSALQANRIQSFDTASYLRLKNTMGTEWRTSDDLHNKTREERWRLYKEMLASLDTVQETSEELLLELDKLAAELSTLSVPGVNDQSDHIIDEIRRLVNEAKYYR